MTDKIRMEHIRNQMKPARKIKTRCIYCQATGVKVVNGKYWTCGDCDGKGFVYIDKTRYNELD